MTSGGGMNEWFFRFSLGLFAEHLVYTLDLRFDQADAISQQLLQPVAAIVPALMRHRFHFERRRSQRQVRQDTPTNGRVQTGCSRTGFKPRELD